MSDALFVPNQGDRVRIVAIGPGDGFADSPHVIGLEGTVDNAEPAFQDPSWLWLEFGGADRPQCWSFLECRVELVAKQEGVFRA